MAGGIRSDSQSPTWPTIGPRRVMASPTAANTRVATGSRASITRFLMSCHCSPKSRVSRDAAMIVSDPLAIDVDSWSKSKRPSEIAANMSAPARCPNVSMASVMSSVPFWTPATNRRNASAGSSPAAANPASPRRRPDMTVVVLTPWASNWDSIATLSENENPRFRSGAPNWTTWADSCSMPTPVCWVARNSWSMVAGIWSAWIPQSPNTRVRFCTFDPRSVSVRRDSSSIRRLTASRGWPVRPSRWFSPAIASDADPKSAGTVRTTSRNDCCSDPRASPVAPVFTRILS